MLLLCNYYLTYRCNAFCTFCHFADHGKYSDTPYAKLEDFKTNIEQISRLGVKFIDLTGGEPLLHKDIHLMAEYAQEYGMQTSITTNALLYPKLAEKLAGKINLLHFSLDSPDEDEHNRIRKVDCYNHVMESISIARSLGEFPDVLFTVTNDTYKKLPRMHEIARRYDLVLLVNPVFSYFGNPGLRDEAIDFIDEYTEGKTDIYLNKSFLKLRRAGGNNIKDPSCKAVSRVIVISPYNEIILPCYHFEHKRIRIDRPIREIRKSDKVKEFQKMEGRFDYCESCTINCYFEPSFAFPTSYYGITALSSKLKYSYNKLVRQKILKKLAD